MYIYIYIYIYINIYKGDKCDTNNYSELFMS